MKRIAALGSLLLLSSAVTANATPIGPNYPPPGGVSTTSNGGSAGANGGVTFTYTGLNPVTGDYADLWFGPYDILAPATSASSGGTDQAMTLAPVISGNTATWTVPDWAIATSTGTVNVPVEFVMSAYDTSNNPVNLVSAASVAGLTGSGGAVLPVTGSLLTSGFEMNFEFEADGLGVDNYFNSLFGTLCTSNCVDTSFNGGFWEQQNAAPVPEPASLFLMGSGLLAGATRLRRRFRI